jgi:signal transduction histidine kinase
MRTLTASASGGVVQIALPMNDFTDMLRRLTWTLLLSSPLLLAAAFAGGYWMSGRALRPVDVIAHTAERIGSENLAARLSLRGTDDELDRLSDTLNQMLGRLEGAFHMVARFTADASHELRTPVAIIRTTAEVMERPGKPVADHQDAWRMIVLQTERMSSLVDDLLLLARADAGRFELHVESMDLAHTVQAVLRDITVLAAAAHLDIESSVPQRCDMDGDEEALRRVLLALLDNAVKYTPAAGRITVSLRIEDSVERAHAVIEVRDTGIGIGQDDLSRIFDRFYRVSRDRSRRTGGAGLGLSIAKRLASLHGGDLVAESALGQGSSFRLILPLRTSRERGTHQNDGHLAFSKNCDIGC